MRVIDKNPIYLYLSILSFYISSFSIAFMPAGYDAVGNRRETVNNVLAAVFWIGIIFAVAITLVIRKKRLWDIKWNKEYMKNRKSTVPEFLRFFSNRPALVFDAALIIGLLAVIISQIISAPESLFWIFIFITVFSFEMHFVFNGLNYKWLRS